MIYHFHNRWLIRPKPRIDEVHTRFGRCLITLSVVASGTCRHRVFKGVLATTRFGQNVINGQVKTCQLTIATVPARIIVFINWISFTKVGGRGE